MLERPRHEPRPRRLFRRSGWATLAFLITAVLHAQSIQTISPQQCVWRAGNDPGWAAPDFDDSSWQPYSNWNPITPESRMWIRCRADLSSLRNTPHPALQIALYSAYELYIDGRLSGSAGSVQSGAFTMNTIRNWPLTGNLPPPTLVALRITRRVASTLPVEPAPPLAIFAGSSESLRNRRNTVILAQIARRFLPVICFCIIGVLGVILLALWMNDRTHGELLLLALACVVLPPIYVDYAAAAAQRAFPLSAYFLLWCIPAAIANIARVLFFFALARRRVPLVFWILIIVGNIPYLPTAFVPLIPAAPALSFDIFRSRELDAFGDIFKIFEDFAPFVAFLPWKNLSRRMKPLAALCMAWGLVMMVFFAVRLTASGIPGVPDLQAHWGSTAADAEALAILSLVLALLFLLFREQQQTARERAILAGEMASAREIQQYLIPEKLPVTPGLDIRCVYHPAREVGGDFFQVLPDVPNASTLIVIGDVAGKGLKAGMLAALIVGAIRTAFQFTSDPGRILALLNERLQGRGLVTCLALRIDRDGNAELANAGHLPPYIDGNELSLDGALPLGALPDFAYPIQRLRLNEGQSILLVSDGVVEAQNASGELFGFDRTRDISTQSAEAIAQTVQTFGQEDDITVLTLTLVPVEVLRA